MLTRGKIPNVSDGAHYNDHVAIAEEDGINEDNSYEKCSSSSKERHSEERVSFRSNSALKLKNTPQRNNTPTSPILVSNHC